PKPKPPRLISAYLALLAVQGHVAAGNATTTGYSTAPGRPSAPSLGSSAGRGSPWDVSRIPPCAHSLPSFEENSWCRRFEVGTVTQYIPSYRQVYTLDNTTAWVEARWGDQVHRTPNHTLHLNKAVKLDPPPAGMPFSKTGGQLRLQVPRPQCHGLEQPPQREARFWRVGDSSWTQVKMLFAGAGGDHHSSPGSVGAR
uniref:Uncharacterized protein n=1 Tax=Cyanoderma ruficeps TaxID=181631 RepID=A0A8C3R525_9PASS